MNQASGIPVPGVSEALQTASVSFGILATIMSMLNNSGLPSTGDAVLDALRALDEKMEALHQEVLASIDRVGEQIGVLQKQNLYSALSLAINVPARMRRLAKMFGSNLPHAVASPLPADVNGSYVLEKRRPGLGSGLAM